MALPEFKIESFALCRNNQNTYSSVCFPLGLMSVSCILVHQLRAVNLGLCITKMHDSKNKTVAFTLKIEI